MDHIKYIELLKEYRDLLSRIRSLQKRAEKNPAMMERLLPNIRELDSRRNTIHNELKELALLGGRSEADVNFDILLGDSSLDEYGLPEFTITKVNNLISENENSWLEILTEPRNEKTAIFPEKRDSKKIQYIKYRVEYGQINNDPRLDYAFIPFNQESSFHLADASGHFSQLPDSFERVRRALKVSGTIGAEIGNIMLPETFHRGEKWFGIFFPVSQFEKVIDFMRRNREDISIQSEFFNEEQIKKDWQDIVKEEIERVMSEESPTESVFYLLDRYRGFMRTLSLTDEQRNIAYELIDRRIEQEKEKVEEYPNLSDLPLRESHGRRKS